MKILQALQALAVELARRLFALIAEFSRRIFEGRLCITKTIAAVGAGELAVNVDGDASLARAGAGVVGGKNTRSCGGDD